MRVESQAIGCSDHLLNALVWGERDAQNGTHDLPELDDLLHAATESVHRNGKAHSAVGPRRTIDRGVHPYNE